jgi:hypothetical protein
MGADGPSRAGRVGVMTGPSSMRPVVEEFRPLVKNTLRGFTRIRFPSGLVVAEISLHVANGRAWASPPSRQMVGPDGLVMRDAAGKPRWQALITFSDKNARDRWSASIVDVVHAAHPEALRDAVGEDPA